MQNNPSFLVSNWVCESTCVLLCSTLTRVKSHVRFRDWHFRPISSNPTEEEKDIKFVELKLFKCDLILELTRLCIIQKKIILKVSWFYNVLMKWQFLPKYQRNYFWISALNFFCSFLGAFWKFFGLSGDLVCNIINKEADKKPQKAETPKSKWL